VNIDSPDYLAIPKNCMKFLKTWAVTRLLWIFWPSILLIGVFLYLNSVYSYENWKAISGVTFGFQDTTWYTFQIIGWLLLFITPFVQLAYIHILARFEKEKD
jgi:hypothetical protein